MQQRSAAKHAAGREARSAFARPRGGAVQAGRCVRVHTQHGGLTIALSSTGTQPLPHYRPLLVPLLPAGLPLQIPLHRLHQQNLPPKCRRGKEQRHSLQRHSLQHRRCRGLWARSRACVTTACLGRAAPAAAAAAPSSSSAAAATCPCCRVALQPLATHPRPPTEYAAPAATLCLQGAGSVCLDVINQTWSPMFDLVNVFETFLPQVGAATGRRPVAAGGSASSAPARPSQCSCPLALWPSSPPCRSCCLTPTVSLSLASCSPAAAAALHAPSPRARSTARPPLLPPPHHHHHHTHTHPPTHPPSTLLVLHISVPQLLLYPNPSDPLNGEAAALHMRDPVAYQKKVRGGGEQPCGRG